MRSLIFAALVLIQIGALAIDERILQPGSNGTATVLLTVAYVEQSAVFSDDNGLLRRIAYVETRDGAREHDNIWAVSEEALQQTQISDHPTLNVKHNLIALEFDVEWKQLSWEDLKRPLYSALAARLLLFLASERLPDSGDIEGQARFWKQYYNTNGSTSDFTGASYELEGNILESSSSQFFVAFGRNDIRGRDSPTLRLFISSVDPDPVLVRVETLREFTFTGFARNNQSLTVEIPNTFQVFSSADSERDKGIRVTANNSNIVVYGLNYEMFTSDAFLALPCDRLPIDTYEYYAVSYGNNNPHILVLGCEDNTVLQLGPNTIELNRMETYLWETFLDVTGTRIVSNKPLVLYPGHRCTNIPSSVSACDHITEQVPPTAIWGRYFISASYAGRSSGDLYRVLASQGNTTVTVNCSTLSGVLTYNLPLAGSWQEFSTPVGSFCSITSNNPLLVMQFGLGNGYDRVGDPFMMMITPVEQYSNNYVFDVLPEFISNYITIYVTPDNFVPQEIFVDDTSLENVEWTEVYCSAVICGYISYVTLAPGEHRLYHRDVTAHIGVSAYGFNNFNSYGYPGGLRLEPVQLATISFSEATYTVIENEEDVTVELVRSGDVSKEVVVLIGSHPYRGTAAAERDYNPIIEIVTFLSGEVKKLVVIKIIDDANVEFDENFILDLTSGEGVHLSPFSRAEVVIKNDDGKLFLNPRYGSELGGTPIIVSGSKLTVSENDNVTCVFDARETEGFVIDVREVFCVSPELSRTGRVPFKIYIEGEENSFTGIAIYISLAHDKAAEVTFENEVPLIENATMLKLRWSPHRIFPILPADHYTVDIILREYSYTLQEWVFIDIEKNVSNTGVMEVIIPNREGETDLEDSVAPGLIQIRVSDLSSELQVRKRSLSPKLRESVVDAIAFGTKVVLIRLLLPYEIELRAFCEVWGLTQSPDTIQQIAESLPPCPCTKMEIENTAGRSEFFKEKGILEEALQKVFHPDSESCYRQITPTDGSGQQCCYADDGGIIEGPESGGTIDVIAPIDTKSKIQHFFVDVLPHIACCMPVFLSNCERYYEFRPSDDCSRTLQAQAALARGDPHLVTLDGLRYTFNGRGEYTLVETTNNVFSLQGRMVQASGANETAVAGTVFSAIVGKDINSDIVQLEIDENGTLTAIVSDELVVFDITEQDFENITVKHVGNNSIEVRFNSGAYLLAKGENGFIASLLVILPDTLTGQVQGLLGTYNGDSSDDLLPKFGDRPLSPETNVEDIHTKFGVTWIVDSARRSLFFYQPGESWDTFYDPYFIPSYEPTFDNPDLELQAREVCGDDEFCLFDIATTGLVDVGVSTLESSNAIEEIYSFLTPVVCNPPCDRGACVANDTCKCAQGYSGATCSDRVLETCEENICENGGTCSKHAGDYTCTCPPAFSGFLCEEEATSAVLANDTIIDARFYTVTLPKLTESICYEVRGEANLYLNLVSDTCVSVNAFYSAMPGGLTRVIWMSEIGIYAVPQGNGSCVEIKINLDCSATLNGANVTMVQEVDGIHLRRMNKQWRVSVPNCNRPTTVMWITCDEDMLHLQVARGAGLSPSSHGLLGSQSCEKTFRLARSMTSTFSTMINFSMLGLLRRLHRLQIQSELQAESQASGVNYPQVKKHENKDGKRGYTFHSLNDLTNNKICEAVTIANKKAKSIIQKLGMEVTNVKKDEVESDEDHDIDLDENVEDEEQSEQGINDVVKEVCMEDPEDIKTDIKTLSGFVSDGVKDKLSNMQSILPIQSSTSNKCATQTYTPLVELSNGTLASFGKQQQYGFFKKENVCHLSDCLELERSNHIPIKVHQ